MKQLQDSLKRIGKVRSALVFLPGIDVECPRCPKDRTLNEAELFMFVFCRYGKRALYHAKNFLDKLINLEAVQVTCPVGHSVKTPVDDDIYFEFDAFIYSCKSVFEGNILKRSKSLHVDVQPLFVDLAKRAYEGFLENRLNKIRDEVVHLNVFGSSIGSMAELTNMGERWEVKLESAFHNYKEERIDLIQLFLEILDKVLNLIMEILGLFFTDIFKRYGQPDRNLGFVSREHEVRLTDFNIPGFNFNK